MKIEISFVSYVNSKLPWDLLINYDYGDGRTGTIELNRDRNPSEEEQAILNDFAPCCVYTKYVQEIS